MRAESAAVSDKSRASRYRRSVAILAQSTLLAGSAGFVAAPVLAQSTASFPPPQEEGEPAPQPKPAPKPPPPARQPSTRPAPSSAPPAAPPPAARPAVPPPAAPPSAVRPPVAPSPAARPATVQASAVTPPPASPAPAWGDAATQTTAPGAGFYPPLLPYRDGLPVPAGYEVHKRYDAPLLWVSGLTFAVAYIASLGVAASDSGGGSGWLAVPAAGPWVAMTQRKPLCEDIPADPPSAASTKACVNRAVREATTIGAFVVDGLVQSAALLVFGFAIASPEKYLERSAAQSAVVVVPIWAGDTRGIGLAGRF